MEHESYVCMLLAQCTYINYVYTKLFTYTECLILTYYICIYCSMLVSVESGVVCVCNSVLTTRTYVGCAKKFYWHLKLSARCSFSTNDNYTVIICPLLCMLIAEICQGC